jgi:SAM-dependent methyltransferase
MLRLAALNLNKGIRNPLRRGPLVAWLAEHKVRLLLAQEPYKAQSGELPALEGFLWIGGNEKVGAWIADDLAPPNASQPCEYIQRLELGYAVVYNVYLSAYSQAERASQLRTLAPLLANEGDRPCAVVGDFNLAPAPADGLRDGAPSDFNSYIDRGPFTEMLNSAKLVDATASSPPEFTIVRRVGTHRSEFRCDLALLSDYWFPEMRYRYDHAVRVGKTRFTDHSAILLDIPLDLASASQRVEKQLLLWNQESTPPAPVYKPHKTAMARPKASPFARAVVTTLVPALGIRKALDFGCGRGADVAFYRSRGLEASGYDPYPPFGWSEPPVGQFDLVTVIFVLNVLPDPWQRLCALKDASRYLAPHGVMLVATRSPDEIRNRAALGHWPPHNDGFWSAEDRGTFQKGVSASEIRRLAARLGLAVHDLGDRLSFDDSSEHCLLARSTSNNPAQAAAAAAP